MSLSSIQLEAFSALAQTNNFTRAAEKLHISQSALSQRIANLEEELGTTLFLRDRTGLQITETGHELLRYCQMKDGLENDFLQHLQSKSGSGLSGRVRIAGYSSLMSSIILPAIAHLILEEPLLNLQTHTREMRELPELLRRGEADYIVLDHELLRDDIETKRLGDEHYILVEKKGAKVPEVFLDHDEEDTTTLSYLKLSKQKSQKIRRAYVDDIHGILEGVRAGIGRAVLPLHLVKNDVELKILSPETILRVPATLHFYRRTYYPRLHEKVLFSLANNALGISRKTSRDPNRI